MTDNLNDKVAQWLYFDFDDGFRHYKETSPDTQERYESKAAELLALIAKELPSEMVALADSDVYTLLDGSYEYYTFESGDGGSVGCIDFRSVLKAQLARDRLAEQRLKLEKTELEDGMRILSKNLEKQDAEIASLRKQLAENASRGITPCEECKGEVKP